MRADRVMRAAVLAFALVAGVSGASAAPDPAAADAAFDAGETAHALVLYDEILAADANDLHALLRSGQLLSWDRKYDEALVRYGRALARDPENAPVLLERGKVLLWSRRYDEAIPAFDHVLKLNRKEPWALCGTAQAYAWSGRRREARPFYERALAAQPGMKEATLGLAYLDLEDGDTTKALAAAKALATSDPTDPEVIELGRAVRRARAPWVQIGWDGADDSDDNRMNTYRAEGGFGLPARMDLRFGFAHSDLHGPVPAIGDGSGQADSLYSVLGWQPRPQHRVELRLGATRLTDDAGDERTPVIGGLSYTFPMAAWTGRASVSRDPFLYSPRILDNAIDVTSFTFSASGLVSPHVRIDADAGFGDFSDGNSRVAASFGAGYVWTWPHRSLVLGGAVRGLDYADDLDNGYFDPQGLIAALLSVRSEGSIGASPWFYEAALEAGAQSFTFDGAHASHEALFNVHGLVGRPLGHGVTFQIFADFGNSSAASGPGYTSRSGGVRLRYVIGG